jgi:hypothetical protein
MSSRMVYIVVSLYMAIEITAEPTPSNVLKEGYIERAGYASLNGPTPNTDTFPDALEQQHISTTHFGRGPSRGFAAVKQRCQRY